MSLARVSILLMLSSLTFACGSNGPVKRDYNYQIVTSNPEIKSFLIKAIEQYNKQAGIDIVGYTENTSRSTLRVTKGKVLKNCKKGDTVEECNDPKIGLARYLIRDGTTYGDMQLSYEYLASRTSLTNGINKEGFILFSHEHGHVMGFEHVNNPRDLMDPTINNAEKDIPLHFVKAVYSYQQDYPTNVI